MARTRNKMVSFFEVRKADGGVLPEPIRWADHLAKLAREPPDKRMQEINDLPHWGQVYPYGQTDHLVLARMRDDVSALNEATGQIIDVEADASTTWVEISVIHFLPGTNRLGFVLGSNASPRVSAVAEWINNQGLLDQPITIEPVIAENALTRINGAAEASLLRVRYASDQLAQVETAGGLYSASQQLKEEVGHVSVEVVLRVEGGTRADRRRDRERLMGMAKNVVGNDFTTALARLVHYDQEGRPRSEEVDFLKHRIAKRMKVSLTDREGNPVRISSAIDAIYRAADRFRDELYER